MTSPIDPIRRTGRARMVRHSAEDAPAASDETSEDRNLPVPVDAAPETPPPPKRNAQDGAAVFAAQLMGQDGQKRGLRGGPPVLDAAKSSYNRTEWSGPSDRRAQRGRITKTEI